MWHAVSRLLVNIFAAQRSAKRLYCPEETFTLRDA